MVVIEHATRLDAAAADDAFCRKGDLPRLRHDAEIILRLDGAQRAQAETIETGTDDGAIAEDQRGRTVILLLIEREIFQHRFDARRESIVVFPCRRHHRDHGGDEVETILHHPRLQGLVQPAAVRLALGPDDAGILRQRHGRFRQPVLLVGVELTIMRHQAERLRHGGVWIGIGGKPRVEIHRMHFMARIGEVAEIGHDLVRVQTPFEHLRPRTER
ncbi:hypothetical protein D3C71_1108030 [compost metagenome]